MIIFFSGTGNSRYVAKRISNITGDSAVVSLNSLMREKSDETLRSDDPFVIVCPTYAWRIPIVISRLIKQLHFKGTSKVYFVLTCGTDTGNAFAYIKKICYQKNMDFMGLAPIIMPENYIVINNAPDAAESKTIIQKADEQILTVSNLIKEKKPLPVTLVTLQDKIKSGIINPVFYSFIVKSKGFYATNDCNSCGKCVKLCPLCNIKLKDGKPNWENNCTHCMACICACPKDAIEYSNKTQGKRRYMLDEE